MLFCDNESSGVGLLAMLLLVAATQTEMSGFNDLGFSDQSGIDQLVSGVGPLESGITLTRYLGRHHRKIHAVVNFGIGGAYLSASSQNLSILDICLAGQEVLADFGICYGTVVEPFEDAAFPVRSLFNLDNALLEEAGLALAAHDCDYTIGTFVTVNGASGNRERGDFLSHKYGAICENMEGAAVARVCEEFGLPMLEVRAISNFVEDRPGSRWRIEEAAAQAARAAALILTTFQEQL